jgi:hypothetical protein
MATNNFNPLDYGATKFDPYKYGATPVGAASKQEKQPGLLSQIGSGAINLAKNVGNALISSEKKFGEDIGKSAYLALGGQNQISKLDQQNVDTGNQFLSLAKRTTDTLRKRKLVESAAESFRAAGMASEDIIGQIKSNKQLLGDAGGVLVDVLSAGTYSKVALAGKVPTQSAKLLGKTVPFVKYTKSIPTSLSGIQKGVGFKQGFGKGFVTGAGSGALYGSAKGATTAMEEDSSWSDVGGSFVGGGIVGGLAGGAVGGITGGIAGWVSKKGKTYQDILATPEEKVYKLAPDERSVWLSYQKNVISSKTQTIQRQVESDLQNQIKVSIQSADDLERELAVATRDKVIELRPKINKALSEQSATYRKLVEEELADKRDLFVRKADIENFIDIRFADNPAQAASVKSKLGLIEPAVVTSKKGSATAVSTKIPDVTIGDLFDKISPLRNELGSAAKQGVRVYNRDEKLAEDSISTLANYLKTKGVNLAKANKFWSEYAPVRNQLIKEAKPFLRADINTKTFANTLSRVAKGTDVNNENFIDEVEGILGEKITGEAKRIAQKMTENDKLLVASKANAEAMKLNAKLEEELAKKIITQKEFEIQQKANVGKGIRTALKVVTGMAISTAVSISIYRAMGSGN